MQDTSYYDTQPNAGMPRMINPLGMPTSLGVPGISSFFKFVDLIVSKSVSDFTLEYPRLIMHLAPLMVAETLDEYQKNNMLVALTKYIVVVLSPEVKRIQNDDMIDEDAKEEIVERFQEIKAKATACGNVKIESSIERSGDYVKYAFSTHHSIPKVEEKEQKENTKKDGKKAELEPIKATVESTEANAFMGLSVARDNGYNRINCQAENNLTDALTLAADLGLISFEDTLIFEERSVTPGDVKAKIERQREILGKKDKPQRRFVRRKPIEEDSDANNSNEP